MKVHHDLNQIKFSNPVVTIGTFDGLHKGHIKVLSELKTIANNSKGESVVFTFWPHPRLILDSNSDKILLLNTLEEKIERFEKIGIDHLVIYPFSIEFSKLSYIDFVEQILVQKLNTHILIIGYDHKFGNEREGGYENLSKLSKEYGFNLKRIEALGFENINVSSTKIRNAIISGDLETAEKYLGYSYMFSGMVVEGRKLGNKIGFPTANIHINDYFKIIPEEGVFAVNVEFEDKLYNGMLNIGYNPTVSENRNKKIEVNIFDFNSDIYHKKIKIILRYKLRNEVKFESIDKLVEQLHIDKKNSLKLLH